MVYSFHRVLQDGEDRSSQISGVCRGAALVEHDLEGRLCDRKIEHGSAEVLTELAVQPRGADDDVLASRDHHHLLTVKFGEPVHARRGSVAVLRAWCVVRLLAEDVVSGDLYQPAVNLFHRYSEVPRGLGIELIRKGLVALRGIYIGICRTVDYGLNMVFSDDLPDCIGVGYVEPCRLDPLLLRHVSEDIAVLRAFGHQAYLVAELAVGPCHKYVHVL